jgi:hypothetical protein
MEAASRAATIAHPATAVINRERAIPPTSFRRCHKRTLTAPEMVAVAMSITDADVRIIVTL